MVRCRLEESSCSCYTYFANTTSSSQSQLKENIQRKIKSLFGQKVHIEISQLSISTKQALDERKIERYKKWRSCRTPDLSYKELKVDLSALPSLPQSFLQKVETHCLDDYKQANLIFEQAIGDTALRYIYKNGDPSTKEKGPLLEFANKLSQRYLDLYRAYVLFEMSRGLPMLSNGAGQLKNHGFETEQVIRMQGNCQKLLQLLDSLKKEVLKNKESELLLEEDDKKLYYNLLNILFNKEKRADFLSSKISILEMEPCLTEALKTVIWAYQKLDVKTLDHVVYMMSHFGKMSFSEIELQLNEVANQVQDFAAKEDERLLMEIRHRIGGDGSVAQHAIGSLGQNPLAYLNAVRQGEQDNLEAEFRHQMYFVYMSNHFANAVMQNQTFIHFANLMLQKEDKGWQIDPHFVLAMNQRKPQELPPLFRYGSQAALGKFLRRPNKEESNEKNWKHYPNPTLEELITNKVSLFAYFRYKLTDRELLYKFGDLKKEALDLQQPARFWTGATAFYLNELTDIKEHSKTAKLAIKYIKMVNKLCIPVIAGPSGTLDQSATMAGLVGMCIKKNRQVDLEILRLAYLAFMVPNADHSVHEIMQSAKTFGLEYTPGPGFEKFIYPHGGRQFVEHLKENQYKRGYKLPSYYLSKEHAWEICKQLIGKLASDA